MTQLYTMYLPQRGLPDLRGAWLRFAGWLLCGNTILLLLVGTAYLRYSPPAPGLVVPLFTALMFIGQFFTIALVFQLPLFAAAVIWPRRWLMLPLSLALGTLMVAGIALDVVVYSQYRLHIDASILQLVFGGAGGAIFVFSPGMYAKCGLVVLGIVAIQWVQARSAEWCAARPRRVKGWVIGAGLMIAMLAENGIFAWADAAGYSPVLGQGDLLPLYHPVRCRDCFAHFGIQSEHVPGAASAGGTFHYPMEPVVCKSSARRMNILFLLIDSWRFDALTDRATPHIAEFARQSIVFTQHFSGGSATRSGIFSLMYGIPATYWQTALTNQTPPALMRALLEQGYRMGIFASAPLTSPEFNLTVFSGVPDLQLESQGATPSERDEDITRSLLKLIDEAEGADPFFGWVFFDAPHSYDFPADAPLPFQPSWKQVDYLALGRNFDPTPFHNRYLNSVHFVDGLVARVIDRLREKGLLDSTIVLISGDHGQEFNDSGNNLWGHNSSFDRYQSQVPLVVHWPGRAAGTNDYRTSHFDIPVTLMAGPLGCTTSPQFFTVGHDLFEPGGRELLLMANFTEYAIVTPERTMMINPYRGVEVEDAGGLRMPGAQPDPLSFRRGLDLKSRFLRSDKDQRQALRCGTGELNDGC